MATTGEILFTQASTTNEDPHLDEPWQTPSNALTDNGQYASVTATTFDQGDQTAILRTYNASAAMAAAIPTGATIDGVIVRVNAYSDGNTGRQIDLIQLLDATGALSGSNLAGPTTVTTDTAGVYTFGSSTEKWGLGAALTRDLLIDTEFGVGLGFITSIANSEAYVDYVSIEVYYTEAHVPTTVYGQVTFSPAVTLATQAFAVRQAQSAFTFTVTRATEAKRSAFAQVALVLSADRNTDLVRTAIALVELPIGVVSSTDATVEQPPAGETKYAQVELGLTFAAATDGHVFLLVNPTADSVDGTWTNQAGGSDLEGAIDEEAAEDSDYIRSELAPSASSCRIKLETSADPGVDKWHALRWRIAKDQADGQRIDLTMRLMEGGGDVLGAGTEIATFTRTDVTETFTTFDEALSEEQAAAITDYSALYLEIQAVAA